MEGVALAPHGILLQRFLTDRPIDRRALYWRALAGHGSNATAPSVETLGAGQLRVSAGSVLSFDTYFNSFFESHWRRHTSLGAIVLRLSTRNGGTLRVFRRAIGRKALLHEQTLEAGPVSVRFPDEAMTFRQHGTLCVELTAGAGDLVFERGGWWSEEAAPVAVGLAAVFCTFNREAEIARSLDTLAQDPDVVGRLARLIVVNQGRPGLATTPAMKATVRRLGGKLAVIEQGNFGGAGGFGRGMLAALDDPAATHATLLDDDILIEPDSLLRMAAFFAFARRDMVVGGHMLDLVQPECLYEAGAVVSERHWEFRPQFNGMDVANADSLEPLSMPRPVHYNGWWLCGFPLTLVAAHGMPLPCFIRGDDVEFGVRLHQRGVPTVALPGISVWHEPFYLKLGGWQHYYETRNLLVLTSLHLAPDGAGAARRIGRQIVQNLLTFRYYTAALVMAGTEAFLDGPRVMRSNPAAQHAALGALRAAYPLQTTPRETVLRPQALPKPPRTTVGCMMLMLWLMLRNTVVPTRASEPRRLDLGKFDWLTMGSVEHVAIESGWDDALPTFQRSRESHRGLLRRALTLLPRLYFGYAAAAAAWRTEVPTLTSQTFWREYLAVPDPRAGAQAEDEPVAAVA